LRVRLLGGDHREGQEIRGVALQTLIWDAEVDAELLDMKVKHGWLTLSGDVRFQFWSDAAYDDVASLRGVVGVTHEIRVITP
jgi:osmotically-inducible protein OsmY